MNEPKRRGRPPKAEVLAKLVDAITPENVHAEVEAKSFDVRMAQNYANRVWAGQSSDIHRKERLGRVEEALKAQGLSMEGVEL